MNKKIIWPAFVLMSLAQLYIPFQMIMGKEKVLQTGKEFRFKAAPVDPYDAFRGKYITLSYEQNAYQVANAEEWYSGDVIYVALSDNNEGFATISNVTKEVPAGTSDYVKATISYIMSDSISNVVIEYPFDRFYMEESKAYNAELAYNESVRDTNMTTYAIVKIKNGDAVISDVIVNGMPVKEAAKNYQETTE